MRKPALPGQTFDMSNIRKTKKCCKQAKTSLTRANNRYVEHPKNAKVLQTSENQLYQGKHPICQHPKIQKVLQTSENQLYHGKHPICQTSEKPKVAENIRKANFLGQTSDMSIIRKTKKCCKQAKTSLTRAKIRYVEHPKNEKVLQTSENQLYQGEHPICQHPKKQKCCKHPKTSFTMANMRYAKHSSCQTSEKPKSAANMRKPALLWQTSDMSNIRKTQKCCKHPKTSFTRANIRYVNIQKSKKCCKHPKTSFTMANIRYVKHPKNQKLLKTSEKQIF